ncbi:hypothetical protein J6T66_01945 [bacterium]|nr:hypothetical protein [bacterium]
MFTPPCTTLPAEVTTFDAASRVPCTTDSQACIVVDATFPTTSVVVLAVHCNTAFDESINHGPAFAFSIVSDTPSLRSCPAHFTH